MTKLKILFVNESLALAGGEKSLIALLSNLNYQNYEIDLQLFRYGRELEEFIPEQVNFLESLPYIQYVEKGWFRNVCSLFLLSNLKFFFSKIRYSFNIRSDNYNHPEKAQVYWESVSNCIDSSKKVYDVAIAYAQGVPTFYVMDKINAKNKIAWVNVNVKFPEKNKMFNHFYYCKYNKIVPVSDVTFKHLTALYPDLENRLYTIYDLVDSNSISNMADLETTPFDNSVFNILTVARLNLLQKGYDITLKACKILKAKGVSFHWYAIGEGGYRQEMEKFIQKNKLENYFSFLGTTANPYPYFKAADLYVQTSRHEGFGLSIAEARLLNTPVVTTRYDSVNMQMKHEKNGLVVDINAEAVVNGIERMMNDRNLYDSIVAYLKDEEKENKESVKRFDYLIQNS